MIYRLLDGWMVFIIKDLIHSFFWMSVWFDFFMDKWIVFWKDGWVFFSPLQPREFGMIVNGNSVPQNPPQVPGLHPSEFEPVTSEPPPGQNWNPSYIGSPAICGK